MSGNEDEEVDEDYETDEESKAGEEQVETEWQGSDDEIAVESENEDDQRNPGEITHNSVPVPQPSADGAYETLL